MRVYTGGSKLNVRSCAGTTCSILGTQANGATGTITDGPQIATGYTWWKVNFASGADGWAVEDYLVPSTTTLTPKLNTLTFNANVPSGQSVAGVQWYLDGAAFGAEDLTSPYSIAVTLANLSAGTHTMYARFRNAAGQTANTATMSFNAVGPLAEASPAPASDAVAVSPVPSSERTAQIASIAAALENLKGILANIMGNR